MKKAIQCTTQVILLLVFVLLPEVQAQGGNYITKLNMTVSDITPVEAQNNGRSSDDRVRGQVEILHGGVTHSTSIEEGESSYLELDYLQTSSCSIKLTLQDPSTGARATELRDCGIGAVTMAELSFKDQENSYMITFEVDLWEERQISFIESRTFAYSILFVMVVIPVAYWFINHHQNSNEVLDKIIAIGIQNRAKEMTKAPQVAPSFGDDEEQGDTPKAEGEDKATGLGQARVVPLSD